MGMFLSFGLSCLGTRFRGQPGSPIFDDYLGTLLGEPLGYTLPDPELGQVSRGFFLFFFRLFAITRKTLRYVLPKVMHIDLASEAIIAQSPC